MHYINSKIKTQKFIRFLLLSCAFALYALNFEFAIASGTDGTIISGGNAGYAWSNNGGWVNFAPTGGNIHITDTGITGYAWNQNYGWINMAPTNGGVTNNGNGILGGNAWGSSLGWINFSGVSVNSLGKFVGQASGAAIGTLTFDCANCSVVTDWRPVSARATPTPASQGGGGGGGLPPEAYNPPIAPQGGFSALINNNAAETDSRNIILTLKGGPNTGLVWISEKSDFPEGYQTSYPSSQAQLSISKTLSQGEGVKTIYAKFCTQWGRCSDIVSDSILFRESPIGRETPPISPSPAPAGQTGGGETSVPSSASPTPIAPQAPEENTSPAPSPIQEKSQESNPEQLFDIRLILDQQSVADLDDLVARVTFGSFGRVPTPVDMAFSIFNANNEKIWASDDSITVQTEAVFVKRFYNLTPPDGSYALRLHTRYNTNVEDDFEAPFTIASAKKPSYWIAYFIGALIILIALLFILKRRRKKK